MLKPAITTEFLALLTLRPEAALPGSANPGHVDAVVTDSKENHIRNLESTDFQIFEDGRPLQITRFSRMNGNRTPVPSGRALGNPTKEGA